MKSVLALTLVVFAASAPAADREVEAHVIALDKQGWEAWKNNDTTEDFRSISSTGIGTKTEVVRGGERAPSPVRVANMQAP